MNLAAVVTCARRPHTESPSRTMNRRAVPSAESLSVDSTPIAARSVWGTRRLVREVGDLVSGIDNDELRLLYQPIIDTRSYQVISAEALLTMDPTRWPHGPAERIVEFAETCGLSEGLATWVFRRVTEEGP